MSAEQEFAARLQEATQRFLNVTPAMTTALWKHYERMLQWNRKLNLTRVTSLAEAVERHYAESLFVSRRIPDWVRSVLDVGSGAGFPGFPIAVARPALEVTLVESDKRKAAFLREVSDFLGNVRVLSVRSDSLVGEWDCITSRAVKGRDLRPLIGRAGKSTALLVGEESVAHIRSWPCLNSFAAEQLPWGERRFLVTAAVSHAL